MIRLSRANTSTRELTGPPPADDDERDYNERSIARAPQPTLTLAATAWR